jgi:hypothetical protein
VTVSGGRAVPVDATAVDRWLAALDVPVAARTERDGTTAWDLVLDGSTRTGVRLTLFLQPGLGMVAWVPYAPALTNAYRVTYQQLLVWNDELPFVKFGLDPELRLVLSAELPARALDVDALGLAIARLLAVCDRLFGASEGWLPPGPQATNPDAAAAGARLLARYAGDLQELLASDPALDGSAEP